MQEASTKQMFFYVLNVPQFKKKRSLPRLTFYLAFFLPSNPKYEVLASYVWRKGSKGLNAIKVPSSM